MTREPWEAPPIAERVFVHTRDGQYLRARKHEPPGRYAKYVVAKADGSPIDPRAEYVVMRVDTDPTCRAAALAWADELEADGRGTLAHDLRALVDRCAAAAAGARE